MRAPVSNFHRTLLLSAVCGLASMASAAPPAALPFTLPPLVQPASKEHHPGKVVWADLVTPDVPAAKAFYGGLFGWTFKDVSTGARDYSVALAGGDLVAGIIEREAHQGGRRQANWLTFISVKDVGRAQKIVLANGGKVLSPPRNYPQRGRQAVFADPQGAVFAVLQSSNGDPPDELADPGEWIWSSLLSHDAATEAAFYQNIFGYEVFDPADEEGSAHLVLATGNYARASANTLPADARGLPPHWLNFVRVLSAKDAAAKAESLGGHVLVQPHPDRHGGMTAVIADPAGAPFGLLEWSLADSKEVAQ
jgi:predicted enzyme related to lactoylglutathione lyase